MKMFRTFLALLAALLLAAPHALAGPTGQTVPCVECGMQAKVTGRFTARLLQGTETLYFCDIGDLVVFLNRKKATEFRAEVRDFPTGVWLDARKAFYARDKELYRTPMGWGVAAFKDRTATAAPLMDLDALRKALP